jgi:hypothetical protein
VRWRGRRGMRRRKYGEEKGYCIGQRRGKYVEREEDTEEERKK